MFSTHDLTKSHYYDYAWKLPVKVAAPGNITLHGEQTIDDEPCVAGDRVLTPYQTDKKYALIWIVNEEDWEIAEDCKTTDSIQDAMVEVSKGTLKKDHQFHQATDDVIVGTDDLNWEDLGAAGDLAAAITAAEAKKLESRKVSLTFSNGGATNIGDILPAGARVLYSNVNVTVAFNGTIPTLVIGDLGNTGRLMESDDNDLAEVTLHKSEKLYTYISATQLLVTLVIDGSTTGACDIDIVFERA